MEHTNNELPSNPAQGPLADLHAAAALMDIPAVRPLPNLIPLTPANKAMLRRHTSMLEVERIKSYKTPDSSPDHSPKRKPSNRVQIRDKLMAVARKVLDESDGSDYTEGETAEAFLQSMVSPGSPKIVEINHRPSLVNETLGEGPSRRVTVVAGGHHPSSTALVINPNPPEIQQWLNARTYKKPPRTSSCKIADRPPTPLIPSPLRAPMRKVADRPPTPLIPEPLRISTQVPRVPSTPPVHDPYAGMAYSPPIPDTAHEHIIPRKPLPESAALKRWKSVKKHFYKKPGQANSKDRVLLNLLPANPEYQGLTTEQSRIMALHVLDGVPRELAKKLALEGREKYP